MNLPGFAAETAFFTEGGQYRLSGVTGGAKPNMVEPAIVKYPDQEYDDDCHCTVHCVGSGIFLDCELLCRETCYIMFDPWNRDAGCIRFKRPCMPFMRFGR
jgi:hypothetical protein